MHQGQSRFGLKLFSSRCNCSGITIQCHQSTLIIQTLHPVAACGEQPYRDGWRAGNWRNFGAEFSDPAPWYFRTLESWFSLLLRSGFEMVECREPTAPDATAPASIIFVCKPSCAEQTSPMEPLR